MPGAGSALIVAGGKVMESSLVLMNVDDHLSGG